MRDKAFHFCFKAYMLHTGSGMFEDIKSTMRFVRSQLVLFSTGKELWQTSHDAFWKYDVFKFHYLDSILIMQKSILFTCNSSFSVDNCGRYYVIFLMKQSGDDDCVVS